MRLSTGWRREGLNRELMRENCTGARMNALRRLLPSGEKYWPCPVCIDVTDGAILAAVVDEFRGENVADTQRHAVLEHFFVHRL